ncbi:unnamed protein product [Hymenolepis diminuta]|uniref:Uncharacterized protein n=1 Tax=Hymenolepis diminuta TaxID=6216 RepID=A0A3P6XWV0_HYMDI|nr:unnamed protein product [Hymenolepis diminuta]
MIFLTNEQLWMVLIPLDGDPYKATSIIVHPCCEHGTGYASALAISRDRRFIFTAGGPDNSMHMWRADPGVLVAQTHAYCNPMQPFYDMLTEVQLNDLKDFFYLSLLRVQGVDSMDTRKTSYTIPITEIPNLTRAMGLFLSEFDVENMMNEVKYSQYSSTGFLIDEFDLDTFIKREPISRKNLVESLSVLLGLAPVSGNFEDSCILKDLQDLKEIDQYLPPYINGEEFYRTILGTDVCESDQPDMVNARRRMQCKTTPSDECCQTEL